MESIIDDCASVARAIAPRLGVPRLSFRIVTPGQEKVGNDYVDAVVVHLSGIDQLRPPPQGSNLVYAVAHEVGHLTLAAAVGSVGALPPVVWDEAFADALARDLFLPTLWRKRGPSLWPGGWDPAAQLPRSASTPFSYEALLERQRRTIDTWTRQHGWATVLDALSHVAGSGCTTAERYQRAISLLLRSK